jgi:AcrR family transcriptional regulator
MDFGNGALKYSSAGSSDLGEVMWRRHTLSRVCPSALATSANETHHPSPPTCQISSTRCLAVEVNCLTHGFIQVRYSFRSEVLVARWNNSLETSAEIQRLKRAAVLQEAGKAFSARGYHNTSLDDVAKALGVAKGTLYNYVKNKQEILWELHLRAAEIARNALASAQAEGGTGAQVLRGTLLLFIRGITEELGACRVLVEFDALKPQDQVKAKKLGHGFVESLVDVIEVGIADGSIRQVDPRLMVYTFMGAVNWIPRWYSPSGRLSSTCIAESIADILLHGLVAKTPRPLQPAAAKTSLKPRPNKQRARAVGKGVSGIPGAATKD